MLQYIYLVFFFFNDTATTEIYTLSLHDALPISVRTGLQYLITKYDSDESVRVVVVGSVSGVIAEVKVPDVRKRSEEHTSELQSHVNLVCRLLLEKKKIKTKNTIYHKSHNYTNT